MLGKLGSSFFIKKLFCHLKEKIKLKLIKYNKILQNEMNINLINYKFYSKRYTIVEKDGKAKEYDGISDNLLFEGEYLNKMKNGKGKEYYYDGGLSYEGEYLNGKRNGKGKEYIKTSGNLKYEGKYKNGKKHGKV